jgi:type I restriction enzyme M protein
MEACIVICRSSKPAERAGKVLFIDAAEDIVREKSQSFLKSEDQGKILDAYQRFADIPKFAKVASTKDVLGNEGSLSIRLYIEKSLARADAGSSRDLADSWVELESGATDFWSRMDSLVVMIDERTTKEGKQ